MFWILSKDLNCEIDYKSEKWLKINTTMQEITNLASNVLMSFFHIQVKFYVSDKKLLRKAVYEDFWEREWMNIDFFRKGIR